ncbi:MAG: DNA-binding protein [Candidatus Aenigmarchaeota archaeon]|nr:DNA-binding protein [Candidatus Aenigmarchaeota archaeon]
MKIAELTVASRNVNITGTVTQKEEPREVNTRNGVMKVANAVIEDDSGSMKLTLWGDETEKVIQGAQIKIENGFVKEWNGEIQLSVGKFGKLTIL